MDLYCGAQVPSSVAIHDESNEVHNILIICNTSAIHSSKYMLMLMIKLVYYI